jgi:hypothetical protein
MIIEKQKNLRLLSEQKIGSLKKQLLLMRETQNQG